MRFILSAVLLLLSSVTARAQSNLDEIVQRAMKEFNVPGMAVGVIQDGKVQIAKGYGVRKLGDPAPVTSKTLFQIASNTKAFTSASLAILIDSKKLSWDDRVIDVLPSFQMSDPYVTREMRIRDLLSHRSGLPLGGGDLMTFPDAVLDAGEVMRRLRFVPLATSFRSHYAYDNILYTVAGEVIEKIAGQPWNAVIQEKILTPLGMTESRPRSQDLTPADEVAYPHAPATPDSETLQVVPISKLGPSAPAGAILSSVDDMLKWADVQLHEGEYSKGRLFSAEQSREMWTPQIFLPSPSAYPPELQKLRHIFQAYALGWVVYDYQGQRVVMHTGGLNGMVTRVTLVPDKKLGVIVFTNQQQGSAFTSVTLSILDHYLGVPPTEWVAAYSAVAKRNRAEDKATVKEAGSKRDANSRPSLPLAKYAGRYRDPWYGDILITENGGALTMSFTHSPTLVGQMEHYQYDTFIVRWKDRTLDADSYVTFALNPDGSIRQVKMKAVSPTTDFSFDFHDLDLKPVAPDATPY